jgi:hypothetical protein
MDDIRSLTGELLLRAWEEGKEKHALARGLILLSLALAEGDLQKLGQLSLGERNYLLLRLHQRTFGPVLNGFGICPQCSAQLEFTAPVAGLIEHLQSQRCEGPMIWEENGRQYQLRPVTSSDLLALLESPDAIDGQKQLLRRCLTVSGEPLAGEEPHATPSVVERFEQLHAPAEMTCVVQCAACFGRETLELDIAQFVWVEIRNAAKRLLAQVHELAWAYGWSEEAILRMSPHRRNAYMEMLSG